MSEAPERIWADTAGALDDGFWAGWHMDGATEYVRADLVAKLVEAAKAVNHDNIHGNGLEGFRTNRDRLRRAIEKWEAGK
jgi:hypothetical protein